MNLAMLPKVDKILLALADKDANPLLLAQSAREAVDRLRAKLLKEAPESIDKDKIFDDALDLTMKIYHHKQTPSLRPVINATGVPLHTNLGRAPIAEEAVEAMAAAAKGYCNLELSLDTGKRGSRYDHVVELIKELTGAQDALVVNNNAAAVFLVLDTLAKGGEAIVSRGQLVEIGDSFRIPDIMKKSGVDLVEVGTTNKTRLSDYEDAISDKTTLLMQVHPSNFKITGFHEAVKTEELVKLGLAHNLPVMDDLGAGCLFPLAAKGYGDEPLVSQVVGTGASIVTCSGDKLLGGPQAGIILGNADYISKIKKNPLTRALRIDKFTLVALESTLRIYRRGEAEEKIPVISMITAKKEDIVIKAELLAKNLREHDPGEKLYKVSVKDGNSETGGGSLPGVNLPTALVEIELKERKTQDMVAALRQGDAPMLAYIREDKLMLDPRTMSDEDCLICVSLIKEKSIKNG